jgi:hypothetical protein
MKLKVLKGPKLGAITPREIVERHRAEAPSVSNHEKIYNCQHRHKAGAGPFAPYPMGAASL